ncbi:MAG: hypothetical protein J7K73_02460 [Nanoarchaeota archaeon]|nr:hypothetical protein [Nanoarchaeota archaeon]
MSILQNEMERIQAYSKLEELINHAESDDSLQKGEARKALKQYVGQLVSYPAIGNEIPDGVNEIEAAKKIIGILEGKHLTRKLPDIVKESYDMLLSLNPTIAYKLFVEGLEEIGAYVGVTERIDGYSELLKQIEEGKLPKEKAEEIAKNFANKYLRKAFEEKVAEKEDVEDLIELYAEVWSSDLGSKLSKANYQIMLGETELRPFLKERKDDVIAYANNIKQTALANGKAKEFEMYKRMKEYVSGIYGIQKKVGEELEKNGMTMDDLYSTEPEAALA